MREFNRITIDPLVMGGKPCIRGMRVTVATIVGLLAAGHSHATILENYPYLEEEDLRDALAYSAFCAEQLEGHSLEATAASVSAQHFWDLFARELRLELHSLGTNWGATYEPSKLWTPFMVTSKDAFLKRLGEKLGFRRKDPFSGTREIESEYWRIDITYFKATRVNVRRLVVAIEHEGDLIGCKRDEVQKLREFRNALKVLITYYHHVRCRKTVRQALLEMTECLFPDEAQDWLFIVGAYFESYGLSQATDPAHFSDYCAFWLRDGVLEQLEGHPVLPARRG